MVNDDPSMALQRLCSIDWSCPEREKKSHVGLMQEYLRRAALLGKKLNAVSNWPFFDMAKCINEALCVPTELEAALDQYLARFILWPTVKKSCRWYLKWSVLKNRVEERNANSEQHRDRTSLRLDLKAGLCEEDGLLDPYEPLIVLYERGGRFYTEHGFINVGSAGIPAMITGWTAYHRAKPFVDLDTQALDRIDDATNSVVCNT